VTSPWVLVVDDDDDIRDAIVTLLELEGYRALGAGDGLHALDEIRGRGRPNVILLDLRMPRMNGEELAAVLRGDPTLASAPIVVLSGDTNAAEVASSIGARALLLKPVALSVLLAAVRRFVPDGPDRVATAP
jgi:chemosensory pili system protein ChpA (sensor histidine kinase/response regulator)